MIDSKNDLTIIVCLICYKYYIFITKYVILRLRVCLLVMSVIEFNHLVDFIFGWKYVEIGKIMWKNWLHIIILPISTCKKISNFIKLAK